MEQTLKITNVLSDPTRYYIYQYITNKHKEVTVQEVAEQFNIHPNVARLHLSKLEDVKMLASDTQKTGKGGRPSRLYSLSDEVIQLHFPYRDYQLLAKIAMQTLLSLGEPAKQALYDIGKRFGQELIEQETNRSPHFNEPLSFDQKMKIIKNAAIMSGFHPEFEVNEDSSKVYFQIFNCPFKEVAESFSESVCQMHAEYIKGMFEALFDSARLIEKSNILNGCESCSYRAILSD
ncbi:helix-turn-helix domain-containing protein [Cytobacillus depressus]|uniref:Helix-turn-helix domain-containing protein n=1 Tax=Cytobacillus depressus TaxID=1602942 RepID=A0A6L3V9Z7_9BACI|nr:helix-turn-helix domain-containing protein [Cytobacillus depressus]KAB2338506.1 helix-turn-helix domain-containing protein [Cytobacillus depressus]